MLAHTTLLSIERCRRHAEQAGLVVEFVITLDNADSETRRIVRDSPVIRECDSIHEVDFRDLSSCRNYAVQHARGHYVGTF
ncbi:Glycosyltransferase, partial [mine drainage metagenome]